MVKPSRQQSDYGPQEWFTESWSMAPFSVDKGATCELLNESGEGYVVAANLPIEDDETGFLHYKAMISTLGGTQKIEYPQIKHITKSRSITEPHTATSTVH